MTVFNPSEQHRGFRHESREPLVVLLLSNLDGSAGQLAGARVGEFLLRLSPVHPSAEIASEALAGAVAGIVEVSADSPASIARFEHLAAAVEVPLLAAVYEPPLALVRTLLRAGAHDILPMPLEPAELEATLAQFAQRVARGATGADAAKGKLISVIKSGGGVGATAILTQLALMHAQQEAEHGRETCLMDLDLQFGDAAFQLGLRPTLSVTNLLQAGSRLDSALLQATTVCHQSGLKVIGAPNEVLPLESVACDQLLAVVDLGLLTFGTVFVDLPANWTDWSLSLVARSDIVLLMSELTIPALRQARRQLDLLDAQDLGGLNLRVVLNRHEDRLFRNIKPADVRQALGRDVSYRISSDVTAMRAAIDQGAPITQVSRRSGLVKDLRTLAREIAGQVHEER